MTGRERRENLAELDPVVRDRLLGLDEPVDRSDWAAVVRRSRGARRTRRRSFALLASGAAVLSAAVAVSLVPQFHGARQPSADAAALRLSLHLSDGSGLVLYSVPARARFLDNSDDRLASEPSTRRAAIVHSLSGGPFHVPAALVHVAGTARHVTDGPLPGDRALVSFRVFTNAGLKRPAGSAVLTCQYGLDGAAYCDGAVRLEHGVRLTGSGTLNADASHYTLMVTGGHGRGVLTASERDQAPSDLS